MAYHTRYALLALSCLVLGACGTVPTSPTVSLPPPPLSAAGLSLTSPVNSTLLVDHAGFTSEGAKWWAEGAKWWAEGGAKWWAEGVFQPLPANSELLRAVKIDVAQARAPRLGRDVIVAVIDSGIDLEHPMLTGALLPGYDFVDNNPGPSEEGTDLDAAYGHGTAVAGIVRQVAPAAKILPLRVLSPDGSGEARHVASAIRFAVDHGAQIIHLSIAASVSNEGVRAALQYAVSRHVLVVAACGNDGSDRCEAPANAVTGKNPLGRFGVSVSAVNTDGTFPSWSTRGGEVLAPGVALQSAYPQGRTVSASGSSFAAPLVTGALALALAEGKDPAVLAARLTSGTLLDATQLLQ